MYFIFLFSWLVLRSLSQLKQEILTKQVYLECYIKVAGFADFSGLSDIKLRIVGRKKQN